MTENQKLREALQRLYIAAPTSLECKDFHHSKREQHCYDEKCGPAQKYLAALKQVAEAIALPTDDHLPDAGKMVVDHFPDATKMIETAVPVGEREAFERVIVEAGGSGAIRRWPNEKGESYENARVQDYRQGWLWGIEWQARAAPSAGDAVDAQQTPKPHAVITGKLGTHCSFNSSELRKGDPIYTAAQIEAALRKDKP